MEETPRQSHGEWLEIIFVGLLESISFPFHVFRLFRETESTTAVLVPYDGRRPRKRGRRARLSRIRVASAMDCGVPVRHAEFGYVHQIGVAGRLTRSGYIVQNYCGHWAKVRWLLKKGQLYVIPHWGLPLGCRFLFLLIKAGFIFFIAVGHYSASSSKIIWKV